MCTHWGNLSANIEVENQQRLLINLIIIMSEIFKVQMSRRDAGGSSGGVAEAGRQCDFSERRSDKRDSQATLIQCDCNYE